MDANELIERLENKICVLRIKYDFEAKSASELDELNSEMERLKSAVALIKMEVEG